MPDEKLAGFAKTLTKIVGRSSHAARPRADAIALHRDLVALECTVATPLSEGLSAAARNKEMTHQSVDKHQAAQPRAVDKSMARADEITRQMP